MRYVTIPESMLTDPVNAERGAIPIYAMKAAQVRFAVVEGVPVLGNLVIDMSTVEMVSACGGHNAWARALRVADALNAHADAYDGPPPDDEEPF